MGCYIRPEDNPDFDLQKTTDGRVANEFKTDISNVFNIDGSQTGVRWQLPCHQRLEPLEP
jgi:hypothetical protein